MYTICHNINHGESVYNLIDQPPLEMMKPAMYRSRYSKLVRSEACCQKSGCYRTMGIPKVCLCPPENYLKKQSRAPITVRPAAIPKVRFVSETCPAGENMAEDLCEIDATDESEASKEFAPMAVCTKDTCSGEGQGESVLARLRIPRVCCNRAKPAVPSACMGFGIIERGKKDFVLDNALKVIRQPAKVPQSMYVDRAKGDRFEWRTSGYPRKYVCRQDYGMLPGYLVARKQKLFEADEKTKVESEAADAAARAKCRHIDEPERQCLINGLKTNWAETYREYQFLPLCIDTPALVKKKNKLEAEMKDLEKDIQLMERHNHIFVADTTKSFYLH